MARSKVSLSLDSYLLREVDAYLETHDEADRSGVVDDALRLWAAEQQRLAMIRQYATDTRDPAEEEDWNRIRDAAARVWLERK